MLGRPHASARVSSRHLVLPLEQYGAIGGFAESKDLFIAHAVQLGAAALTGAAQRAGIGANEVDLVISATVTPSPFPRSRPGSRIVPLAARLQRAFSAAVQQLAY